MQNSARRKLFSRLKNGLSEERVVRLPYYESLEAFETICLECNDKPCITSCEEGIIKHSSEGSVKLDFSQSGCSYCEECLKACERGVLTQLEQPIHAKVTINVSKCMSWHGVMCFTCKDPCMDDAIEFKGLFTPSIIEEKCSACGFCLSICPSNAIEVSVI